MIHLTETKHSHIKSMWREALKDYKLIRTYQTLDLTTNRRSVGSILAARRDTTKEATAIHPPPHIGDYISAATLIPHDGSPIIAILAYMPQFHTKAQDITYTEVLTWIHTEMSSEFPTVTTLMGGDLQANPTEGDKRSYYAPINRFYQESGLKHITPKDTYTYIPAKR